MTATPSIDDRMMDASLKSGDIWWGTNGLYLIICTCPPFLTATSIQNVQYRLAQLNISTSTSIKVSGTKCSVFEHVANTVFVGGDRTTLEVNERDEIKCYLDSRYCSSPKAVW